MSVVGHQPPPFFKRGPAPVAQLFFFFALSLSMLIADLRFGYLELVRQVVSVVTYPLQRAASAPVSMLLAGGDYFVSLQSLQAENAAIKRSRLNDSATLLRVNHLEDENRQLRALLEMKQRQPVPSVAAEILFAVRDPFRRRVILDKGAAQGMVAGQAVIDDKGVVGQVTRVYLMQSEVTLLTDKDQAIPVQIVRNGLRALMFGTGDGLMELRYLAANADVQANDVVVTSGLDGVFLPGLEVARVLRVDRDQAFTFARIVAEPIAGVERRGQVLVLARREVPPAPPEEPAEPVKPGKSRLLRRPGHKE